MNNRAQIKFNNGNLAILCSQCRVIIKTGFSFTDKEFAFARGEIDLAPYTCIKCKRKMYENKNIVCYYHNKDMDGFASGAIVQYAFPNVELRGWDYKDPVPSVEEVNKFDYVILIDITFPLDTLLEIGKKTALTVIDHHITFKKQIDEIENQGKYLNFYYVYEENKAACEIAWEHFFHTSVPYAIKLIGRYDTWRQTEGDWEGETLPFKYYMYSLVNDAENFPEILFKAGEDYVDACIETGCSIMMYQETMDRGIAAKNAFETEAYGGFLAICINYYPFNSEVLKNLPGIDKYEIQIGFCYYPNGKWGVSLRSKGDIDVSAIAKARGGGGHAQAAGFEVDSFDKIFI